MAARTVVCPECSETLPYGRLSCPACGSLLAAVAGGRARAVAPTAPAPSAAVAAPEPAEPAVATDEAPGARPRRRWRAKQNDSSVGEGPQATVAAGAAPGPTAPSASPVARPRRGAPMLAPSKVGAVTLAARLEGTTPADAPTPPVLGDWVPSETGALGGPSPWRRDGVQRPRDEDFDGLTGQRGGPAHAGVSSGNGAHGTGALPAWAGGPPGSSVPVGLPAAVAPVGADRAKATTPPPGAYLPPSGAFTARDSGLPRGQLVLPGSSRGAMASASGAGAPLAAASVPSVDTDKKPRPGVSLLADLPFGPPNSLPGWLIAAGSAAAIAGLLLPWSRSIPFATGFGYLDTWGLATPSHLLLLLLTMVTLSLAILPNRVATWLRNGVAGLVVGGLLLGITWPYLLDGFGAMIGALAEAAAGLLLIIGGLLAVRQERHAEDEPAV